MRRFLAVALAAGTVAALALGVTSDARAQSTPPGVDVDNNLFMWLDATDIDGDDSTPNPTSDSPVATWVDKSGGSGNSNNTLTSGQYGMPPTLSTGAAMGNDVVTFDEGAGGAETQYLEMDQTIVPTGPYDENGKEGMTAFYAMRSQDGRGRFMQTGPEGQAGDNTYIHEDLGNSGSRWSFAGHESQFGNSPLQSGDGGFVVAAFSIPNQDDPSDSEMTPGTGTSGDAKLYINGVQQTATNITEPDTRAWPYNARTTLGTGRFGSDSQAYSISGPWSGQIGEMLVYESELTADEVSDVSSYLEGRWVPSPATLPMALMGLGALTLAGRRRRQAA